MFKTLHLMGGAGLVCAFGALAVTAIAEDAKPREETRVYEVRIVHPEFADIDTNKDGVISKSEFDAFHAKREQMPDGPPDGPPPPGMGEHHRRMMMRLDGKALDKNGDGKISFDEFVAPMKAHFDELDANHDGVLDKGEMPKPPEFEGGMGAGDAPPPPK